MEKRITKFCDICKKEDYTSNMTKASIWHFLFCVCDICFNKNKVK